MNPNNWSGGMAGGVGRGMPNMNMSMGMGMGMGMNMNMNPNIPQQKGPNFHAIIYQNLTASQQADGPFNGWRSHVAIQERASQVKILFDSLRMLGQAVDIRRSLDIAVAFERRQFLQSSSLEAYKQSLHDKLSSIRDQRQQQAVSAVNNMPNNMQMMNPAFQQAQQPTQVNQMTPNMNFQQPSGMQPSPSFNPMVQRPMNQPNQAMNPNQMNQPNRPNPPELTKEDNTWINTRAAEMAKSTARDEMARIVESMEPRVRQSLQEKKIDPIIYHFRMKATKEFRVMQAQKNAQNQLNNMARMSTPQQNPVVPVTQPNGNAFMDIEAFRSQQDEGMRSQQEGQLVVPASQPNVNDIRQRFAQQIRAQNPNASQPELQQMLMNRLRQWQAQMQARSQLNSAQPGMIQNVGQGQNLTGGMPQPRPVSVLNQPMNQQGPGGSPAQNLARPQSRPQSGQPGQPMGQAQPMQGQFTPEQIMGHWEKLPLPLKNMLNSNPHNMWPKIVMDFRQRSQQAQQQANAQRQMMQQSQAQSHQQQQGQQQPQQPQGQQPQPQPQQGSNMQRTLSQQPPNIPANQRIQQIHNNQFAGPVAMQQSLSRGAEQPNAVQNMTPVQRPQQPPQPQAATNAQNALRMQQQQLAAAAALNQNPQNQAAEDALIRESDDNPLPANMRSQLGHVFPGQNVSGLNTWRQLRELAISVNDQRIPPAKIRAMQLQYVRRLQQQRAAMAANGGQSMQQPSQAGGQGMVQQNSQNPRPQLTPQDIMAARRQNPTWGPLSDDQIRSLIQQQPKPGNQKQQPNAPSQVPNLPTSQVQNNTKAPTQQNQTPQAPQQNRQPAQNQNQNQNQATKPAAVAEPKNLKRPNQDDAPEQNNVQQGRKFGNQVQITKEQFEKMTPAEQEKFKQEHKRYESVRRVAQLSQEVNAMKKLPPITNMDPQSRQRITNMLTSDTLKGILTRFDTFLVAFAQTDSDLQMLQTLIQHRWRLVQQFKPESVVNKTYVPADLFTLQAENLEAIINQISNKFHQALQKSQRPNAQQSIPLTTENLNMAAQQAAQQQQKRSQNTKPKDAPPPAPTVDKPPFQFPADRGQGTPKYAAPGFKPEDLKLPPKKRPRNDQSASPATPVQASIPKPVFKCNFQGCNMQTQGFGSQAELDQHRNTIHKPDMEPVKDPISFLDGSLQQAFNLDENLQSKRVAPAAAPPMQKTFSRPGSGTQKGNRIGTPSAMARTASQQGGKDSPSSMGQQKNGPSKQTAASNTAAQAPVDEWQDATATFSFDNLNDIFGPNESGDVIPMGNDSMSNIQAVANTYMKNNEDWKWNEREGPESSDSSAKSKSPDQGSEPSLPNGEKAAPPNPYQVDLKVDGNALPVLEGNFEDLFMDDGTGVDKDWTMLDTDGSLSPWEKIEGIDGGNQMQIQPGGEFELESWITMPTLDDSDFPTGDEAMKILEGMPMTY